MNRALHGAQLASADFAVCGKGYWLLPQAAPLTSDAPVADLRQRAIRPTEAASTTRLVKNGCLPRPGTPSTDRELLPRALPSTGPHRWTSGCLFARRAGWPRTRPRSPPRPRGGLGAGHHRLASATEMKPEHTWRKSSTSPGHATRADRSATRASTPRRATPPEGGLGSRIRRSSMHAAVQRPYRRTLAHPESVPHRIRRDWRPRLPARTPEPHSPTPQREWAAGSGGMDASAREYRLG